MLQQHLPSVILREYDIRGIVGETLNEREAELIGRGYASLVKKYVGERERPVTVTVGRDGRLSSQPLEEALIRGINAAGVDVITIGLGPTPMLYFSVFHLKTDGGIMITGSHNPPNYNGFKMMIGQKSIYGDKIREIGQVVQKGHLATGQGRVDAYNIKQEYIARLKQDYDAGTRKLKIAWDCGNGAAGAVLAAMLKDSFDEHVVLFDDVDGTFPNHHPDPTKEANMQDLRAAIAKHGCDLGIAFDGDGDRLGVIDNTGRILTGDELLMILARGVLKTSPAATIIADVKASQTVFDDIARHGGKPIMWKTGHSLIKAKMSDVKAAFAGEMTGHIFYADKFFGFDDAIYAAIRLINDVRGMSVNLHDYCNELPKMMTSKEMRIECEEERKFAVIDEVKRRLQAAKAQVIDVDGVRVITSEGWWLLRASNTENALVARAEGYSEDGLKNLKSSLEEQLVASGIEL